MLVFKIAFWINTFLQIVIRMPFGMSTRSRKKAEQHVSLTENVLCISRSMPHR
jgi:hypothetical protein